MSNSISSQLHWSLRSFEARIGKTSGYRAVSDFVQDASRTASQCKKAVVKAYSDVTDTDKAVENCGQRANLQQNDRASKNQYGDHGSTSLGRAMVHTYKDSYQSTPVNAHSSDADRWKAARAKSSASQR